MQSPSCGNKKVPLGDQERQLQTLASWERQAPGCGEQHWFSRHVYTPLTW